jgi:cell division septal protein FtsQ
VKRRLLVAALALLLLVAGAAGTRALLKKLSFFTVRRIELVGARYLTADAMTRALRLPARASIFDDTGPLARRAATLPGVLEARIVRRLPGVLRVVVREAEPVALAEREGRLVLLDSAGRALPFDPTSPAADLPLAEPDSAVAGLLARLRESDPELFARVQRGTRLRQDIALDLGAGRILFRAGASDAAIRDLSLVADVLTRQGRAWRELDARFLPRVIVRGSGA